MIKHEIMEHVIWHKKHKYHFFKKLTYRIHGYPRILQKIEDFYQSLPNKDKALTPSEELALAEILFAHSIKIKEADDMLLRKLKHALFGNNFSLFLLNYQKLQFNNILNEETAEILKKYADPEKITEKLVELHRLGLLTPDMQKLLAHYQSEALDKLFVVIKELIKSEIITADNPLNKTILKLLSVAASPQNVAIALIHLKKDHTLTTENMQFIKHTHDPITLADVLIFLHHTPVSHDFVIACLKESPLKPTKMKRNLLAFQAADDLNETTISMALSIPYAGTYVSLFNNKSEQPHRDYFLKKYGLFHTENSVISNVPVVTPSISVH